MKREKIRYPMRFQLGWLCEFVGGELLFARGGPLSSEDFLDSGRICCSECLVGGLETLAVAETAEDTVEAVNWDAFGLRGGVMRDWALLKFGNIWRGVSDVNGFNVGHVLIGRGVCFGVGNNSTISCDDENCSPAISVWVRLVWKAEAIVLHQLCRAANAVL